MERGTLFELERVPEILEKERTFRFPVKRC